MTPEANSSRKQQDTGVLDPHQIHGSKAKSSAQTVGLSSGLEREGLQGVVKEECIDVAGTACEEEELGDDVEYTLARNIGGQCAAAAAGGDASGSQGEGEEPGPSTKKRKRQQVSTQL